MKTETIQSVQTKFEQLHPFLSERTRRLWAATEAKQLGWGGVCLVEQATGISHKTIRKGIAELDDSTLNPLEVNRSRNSGAGRKKCTTNNPQLLEQLEALIEPVRGDPESPLRWTRKSLRRLATELTDQGHPIGVTAVRLLLHELQYSLQGNAKTREGADHPDRNEQFLYISDNVKRFLHADQPVISVDTKKKENLGNYSNKGREYRPKKSPLETPPMPRTINTTRTRNLAKRFLTACMTSDGMRVGSTLVSTMIRHNLPRTAYGVGGN